MKLLHEFLLFGLKQAYACIFGGMLLLGIIVTHYWYPFTSVFRYDFLFIYALVIQCLLVATRLESKREAVIILAFHILATAMEIYKTSDKIGSWNYPGSFHIGIANVPLFAGFMYSAVGSYIARVWRLFDFKFSNYPHRTLTLGLAALIYCNFFSHHFLWDFRWVLLAGVVLLFGRVKVYFKVFSDYRAMPLLLGWLLVVSFVWIAENAATFSTIWIYPDQHNGWHMVSIDKLGSWFLLMIFSFILISTVQSPNIWAKNYFFAKQKSEALQKSNL